MSAGFLVSSAGNQNTESFGQKGVNTVNSRSKTLPARTASGLEDGLVSSFETDARWGLAQRIAGSQQFIKSARLQDFLLYVCRCALENRVDEISEQRIGERVFERAPDYNPNEDNIVRSQARLLRQKLEAYFASEGASEPLILRIPKGGYAPEFVERSVQSLAELAESASPAHSQWRTPVVRGLLAAVAALVIVVIALAWLLERGGESASQPAP